MPSLSIITVNLNNKEGLQRTIESITKQTFKDIEYIIIDGGSTDGSKKLIQKHANYVSGWVSEPDKGIYNAMNKGIKKASGQYLLFLNSGDELSEPSVLQKVFETKPREDILYGNYKIDDRPFKSPYPLRFSDFWHRSICHQSVFFSRKLFEQYGLYDESLKIAADWFFLIYVLFKKDASYKFIDIAISNIEAGGLSDSLETYNKITTPERDRIYRQHFPGFYEDYKELVCRRLTMSSRFVKLAVLLSKQSQRIKRLFT